MTDDDEKAKEKKRYRLDTLKVKRKLFNSYPVNSIGRQALLREEKIKELEELTFAHHMVPTEYKDVMVNICKQQLRANVLKTTFGLVLLTLGIFGWFSFATSLLEFLCVGLLIISSIFIVRKGLISSISDYKAIKEYVTVTQETKERIDKLKKELFGQL